MTTNNFEAQMATSLLSLYNGFLVGTKTIDDIKQSFTYRNWKTNYSNLARVTSTIRMDKDMELCSVIKETLVIFDKKFIDQTTDLEHLHLDYLKKIANGSLLKTNYGDQINTKFLQVYNAYLLGLITVEDIQTSDIYKTWNQTTASSPYLNSLLKHNPDIDTYKVLHITLTTFDTKIVDPIHKVGELTINNEDSNEMRR